MLANLIQLNLDYGVKIAVTTRYEANAKGLFGFNLATHVSDDPEAVAHNRELLCKTLGFKKEPLWLDQYHSANVAVVKDSQNTPIRADGSFTKEADLPLAILTADCLPIVLWNESALCVLHAGWRGLASNIIAEGVKQFDNEANAWVGPGISAECYEVDDAVIANFPDHSAFEQTREGHYAFDLYQEARRQLASFGVKKLDGLELCTARDERLYSHRAERTTGRFATIAWRETQ